ncbi:MULTISPECIES: hypothetical protein [unclassified Microbulbifer]|uniref:hypothetical protein n=1 Tax=unclassified Microbulbifer TaxID=2619833 RepID=UPI0027E4C242|nr:MULTISPECIES: hypothetical protein [unclassified Microbulbifer]
MCIGEYLPYGFACRSLGKSIPGLVGIPHNNIDLTGSRMHQVIIDRLVEVNGTRLTFGDGIRNMHENGIYIVALDGYPSCALAKEFVHTPITFMDTETVARLARRRSGKQLAGILLHGTPLAVAAVQLAVNQQVASTERPDKVLVGLPRFALYHAEKACIVVLAFIHKALRCRRQKLCGAVHRTSGDAPSAVGIPSAQRPLLDAR